MLGGSGAAPAHQVAVKRQERDARHARCAAAAHPCCRLLCRFRLLPSWRASPAGLSAAVCATQPGGACGCGSGSVAAGAAWFVQDGLYLRHAEGHYELSGAVSPLALLWKDASCSRYVLVRVRGGGGSMRMAVRAVDAIAVLSYTALLS